MSFRRWTRIAAAICPGDGRPRLKSGRCWTRVPAGVGAGAAVFIAPLGPDGDASLREGPFAVATVSKCAENSCESWSSPTVVRSIERSIKNARVRSGALACESIVTARAIWSEVRRRPGDQNA